MNLPLKFAILSAGRTQRQIAKRTRIDETRLSKILRQHLPATEQEQERLSKALGLPVSDLFPASGEAIAS